MSESNGLRILVVDDSSASRRIIREELQRGGYEVTEAPNGKEAVKLYKEQDFDLITMDMEMPEMDGFKTCKVIRSTENILTSEFELTHVPIVFLTSKDNFAIREKGFELGATDFMSKSFHPGDLLLLVDTLLKSGNRLTGSRVVIVDDSRTARGVARDFLLDCGAEIIEFADGEPAYEFFKSGDKEVDLLLVDYHMPKMNGDELCRRIRMDLGLKEMPIVFLTANGERDECLKYFKCGGTDYLIKPYMKEELISRILLHVDQHVLNKRLRKNVDELNRLHQMKDDFLAVCSHDLRSPLTGLLGFAELVLSREDLDDQMKNDVGRIQKCGKSLLTLVNDILDTAKLHIEKEDLKLESLEASSVVADAVTLQTSVAETKRIQLIFNNKTGGGARIWGNAMAVSRVIQNLISNALKFTPSSGRVEVSIALHQGDVVVSVSDNGIGIPESKLPALFQKFSAASRTGTQGEASTGLGLSIVKDLIEKLSGSVSVESKEGEGTTFQVRFPALDSDRGSNVLILDQNRFVGRQVKRMLTSVGHRCVLVKDENAVYSELEKKEYSAVIVRIPSEPSKTEDSIAKVKRWSGKNGKKVPVMGLVTDTNLVLSEFCERAGITEILEAPLDARQINEKLKKVA